MSGDIHKGRSGGRILVDALRVHGVDRIFCVPGESYLDVLDALHDTPEIAIVIAKHEGAAANMAEADGKLTGRPGICFVTRGPGATHASVGVHTARQDSTPMILFIGQVSRAVRGREAFQEIEFREMFAPVAKWAAEIESADRVPEYLLRAFQVATSGRPGPVVLALPEDMLAETSSASDTGAYAPAQAAASARGIVAVQQELRRAERPLLIVGGSTWSEDAKTALATFARDHALPVAASFRRQDLIDNRHPCYAGHLTIVSPRFLQTRVASADLIIAIGTRLSDITTGGYTLLRAPRSSQRLVHVHPDPDELGRVYQADVAINASASNFLTGIAGMDAVADAPWLAWTESARQDYLNFIRVPPAPELRGVNMAEVIAHLDRRLPEDAVITNGAGNFAVWVHRFYTYKGPHTELASTSGAMGYGLPAAVAAKIRYPDRTVVCVAGDGDFLMYPQELATAAQYGAAVIVLIVNNGMYGTIRMHQERRFPGRVSGTDLPSPDYVGLARALGASAEKVETTDAFPDAFERAMTAGRPAVIELCVDKNQITPDHRL